MVILGTADSTTLALQLNLWVKIVLLFPSACFWVNFTNSNHKQYQAHQFYFSDI